LDNYYHDSFFGGDLAYRLVRYPSFLTKDEKKLLISVLDEWYSFTKDKLRADQERLEQKRKDKFRQEMIDLYKGDI